MDLQNYLFSKLSFSALFVALGFLSGCAYGPNTKDKTFLESLNGKHYESAVVESGRGSIPATVPLIKRRRAIVRLSGEASVIDGSVPFPLANQELSLIQNSHVLAKIRTAGDGSFAFQGDFPDGQATIHSYGKYSGEHAVVIRGFEIQNIQFNIRLKATAAP